jgi:hypothetical protein
MQGEMTETELYTRKNYMTKKCSYPQDSRGPLSKRKLMETGSEILSLGLNIPASVFCYMANKLSSIAGAMFITKAKL